MDEEINTITYEKDWQSVSEPEYPVIGSEQDDSESGESAVEQRQKRPPRHLLLTVQLVACILLALCAFAVKSIGGEVYDLTRNWYESQLNDTAIFDGNHDTRPMLFNSATQDEI